MNFLDCAASPDGSLSRERYFVSACLVGVRCRYDCADKRNVSVCAKVRNALVVFECPECMGGLPVPRVPSELEGGTGFDVVKKRARVMNEEGKDVTAAFLRGAFKVLDIVRRMGIRRAILKAGSPSCGVRTITRNGIPVEGCGVTAALLAQHGVELFEA